eukprot:664829-Amphidinium_carterae.3
MAQSQEPQSDGRAMNPVSCSSCEAVAVPTHSSLCALDSKDRLVSVSTLVMTVTSIHPST